MTRRFSYSVIFCLLGAGAVFAASPVRATDRKAGSRALSPTSGVQIVRDIPYYQGKDADPVKHRLDMYLPKGQKDFPVLFFIHGGAWRHGDKNYLGVYGTLGMSWARHGIGAVVINYRLSPAVRHPEHIKDVARAFEWTHDHIANYGGRPDEIFVCGHSAGGHLAALLATDESYLKAEGLTLHDIRGVIPMSGVYEVREPYRIFDVTFGSDAKIRKDASPITHVRADVPPFLIVYADHDLELCGKQCSETFCRALCDNKCEARTLEAHDRNHITLLLMAALDDDPVSRAVQDFVAVHIRK
jgi:acetyl esterase/lipase